MRMARKTLKTDSVSKLSAEIAARMDSAREINEVRNRERRGQEPPEALSKDLIARGAERAFNA
jgi:hypothetical protein